MYYQNKQTLQIVDLTRATKRERFFENTDVNDWVLLSAGSALLYLLDTDKNAILHIDNDCCFLEQGGEYIHFDFSPKDLMRLFGSKLCYALIDV